MNRRELLGTGAAAAAVLGGSSCSSAAAAAATAGAAVAAGEAGTVQLRPLTTELDSNGVERLALQPEGENAGLQLGAQATGALHAAQEFMGTT